MYFIANCVMHFLLECFCKCHFFLFSEEEVESEEEGEDPKLDSLSQAIAFQVNAK